MEKRKIIWITIQVIQLVLKIINVLLYYFCYKIESKAYQTVRNQAEGLCIKFQEIGEAVGDFLMYAKVPIYVDFVFAVAGLPCYKLYNHSFGILYNSAVAYYCNKVYKRLLNSLTFCGQPMQNEIADVVRPLKKVYAMHIVLAVFTVLLYDMWDIYIWFKIRPKLIRQLRGTNQQ